MKNNLEQEKTTPRLIYFPELRKITGLARSTIFKLEKAGRFPRRRLVTTNRVAWIESEVHAWIEGSSIVEGSEQQPTSNLPKIRPSPAPNHSVASPGGHQINQEPPRRVRNWLDRDDDY